MLIRVLCKDKSCGYVQDSNLQDLIRRGVVVAFSRPDTNDWVNVQEGKIRTSGDTENIGQERRNRPL